VLSARTRTATVMAFRDQRRHPLVPILLVLVPAFIVLWSVAITQSTPHRLQLPGGVWVTTTMKELHGPEMAKFTVAFVSALVGVFVMRSALAGDRRLVVAGFRARETILARLTVLAVATLVVVAVSALVTAVEFTPTSWPAVLAALVLIGLIYGAIGALAGALLDKLVATYLILFLVLADLSVVQTPMFHPSPSRFAALLPGYGPTRLMLAGAFGHSFNATGALLLALAWTGGLAIAVYLVLRRRLGVQGAAGLPPDTLRGYLGKKSHR
jgi:hypothetical protein